MPHVEYALTTVSSGKKLATVPPEPNALPFQAGPQQPSALEKGANDYLLNIVGQKQIPLLLNYDFTFTIPVNVSNPPKLIEQDFTDAADELDVEVEVVKAVNEVEASKGGYEDGHRPTLRYELHIFHSKTHGTYDTTHPWLSQPSRPLGEHYHAKDQDQTQEYTLLYNAMLLGGSGHRKTREALSSASYGRFQVMGFNAETCGWPSVQAFVTDMFLSEGNQLKAFIKYVDAANLTKSLQDHDWATFAHGYNGDDYEGVRNFV